MCTPTSGRTARNVPTAAEAARPAGSAFSRTSTRMNRTGCSSSFQRFVFGSFTSFLYGIGSSRLVTSDAWSSDSRKLSFHGRKCVMRLPGFS